MIEKGESNEIQKCCFIVYDRKPFSITCPPPCCDGGSWNDSQINGS